MTDASDVLRPPVDRPLPTAVRAAPPRRLPWPRVLAAHLLPGGALLIASLAGGALCAGLGLPRIWGLLAGVLVVQVPLLLALSRRAGVVPPPRAAAGRMRPPARSAVVLLGTLLPAALLPGTVVWLEPTLRSTVFGWLPDQWSAGVPSPGALTTSELAVTAVLWLLGPVLLGPLAEERWFRGVLLPRIPGGPWVAAVVNAGLFALYHLWQPYAVLTVFLFALPLAVARARFGASVATCAAVHCLVNLGTLVALLGQVGAR